MLALPLHTGLSGFLACLVIFLLKARHDISGNKTGKQSSGWGFILVGLGTHLCLMSMSVL